MNCPNCDAALPDEPIGLCRNCREPFVTDDKARPWTEAEVAEYAGDRATMRAMIDFFSEA